MVQNPEFRSRLIERVIRDSVRSFQFPKELVCEQTYRVDPADAVYLEKMNDFLLRGVCRHPLMTDDRILNIDVRERNPLQWKTSFALLVDTDRVVSFRDYT